MSAGHDLITLKGVSKRYTPDEADVLANVDFAVSLGESISVVGPSGSGKTTLLHIMGGLVTPDAGAVSVDGRLCAHGSEWDDIRARTIGFAFQDAWLWPGLTAAENIAVPMIGVESRRAARQARVFELLDSLGVAGRSNVQAARLSGGERQRVALARALANRPRLLLADEPTGNLDADNTRHVIALLHEIAAREATAIVIATHDPDVAASCKRHVTVRGGRIVERQDS